MKRKITLFIASPGDLAHERNLFRKTIEELNTGFGDGANVEFEALGWESTLALVRPRAQSVINENIDRCDVFFLVMHRRWGQDAPDAKPYNSYTEEEFHRAFERWKKSGKPEIVVLFKRVDPASEADPGPELKKVMAFRRQLEDEKCVLYHYFDNDQTFSNEIRDHIKAFAKGQLPQGEQGSKAVLLPLDALKKIQTAKKLTEQKIQEANVARDAEKKSQIQVNALQLQIAIDAANLSKEGNIEFARQKFAVLVTETLDLKILSLANGFYTRTGDIDSAFLVLNKCLNIISPEEKSATRAEVYNGLGKLYLIRGEFEQAKEMHRDSLDICKVLDDKEGMARSYGNLGNLYSTRGDIKHAEEMYLKSLDIDKTLDRKKGLAANNGNLGNLYYIRGNLEQAEVMYLKSLSIAEKLEDKEYIANSYASLGNLYASQRDFEQAEEVYQKAITIYKMLNHKQGIAHNYGNLGTLYWSQGDLEQAEEMYQKAITIYKALGCKDGMAFNYENLGDLYQCRGDFELAEKMFKKSLNFFRELQFPETESITRKLENLKSIKEFQLEFQEK